MTKYQRQTKLTTLLHIEEHESHETDRETEKRSTMDDIDTAAWRIPILPVTSPAIAQPAGLKVPLMPHQLRAVYRMQQVECDGTLREKHFNIHADVHARGGCLADAVGMGKTACVIALIVSEPRDYLSGPNLIVLPQHLMGIHLEKSKRGMLIKFMVAFVIHIDTLANMIF